MENCYSILENGIEAVMFNYDSNKQEPVTLTLNKKHSNLKCNLKKQTFVTKYFQMDTKVVF